MLEQRMVALLSVLLCCWAAVAVRGLAYEPIFHVRPPNNWVGAPSAVYRSPGTSTVHLYMQYNPEAAAEGSTAWYHVTSTNYTNWTHASPATALVVGDSYDSAAVLSGVLMANNRSVPTVMYTCATAGGVQAQCVATLSTTAAGDYDFNTFVKATVNPVLEAAAVPGVDSSSGTYFRDPTAWWADPVTSSRWLIGVATRLTDANGSRSHIAAFATTDPTFQSGYSYSHSLYADNLTGGVATLEHPDFFAVTQGGERFLKLSLLEHGRDVVLYGTYALNASSGQYVFTGSTTRRPSVVDYGSFYGAKTFNDAVLSVRRMWGWIKEDVTAAQMREMGWGGVQTVRGVVYDTTERRLRFPPIPELRTLRTTVLASMTLVAVTEAAPVVIYAGSAAVPKYQEIVATFYVPSTLFDGTRYFATAAPEFGLRLRVSPDASRYVSVSVRMPTTNSTATRGYKQPGTVLRQLAVGAASSSSAAAAQCRSACAFLSTCEAWNLLMNVSGFYCEMLSTPAPLVVDCSAQTSRPNVPLLVVERAASGTVGSQATQSGRAPLTNAHAGFVKLHVFVDDSVIEVYKDDGMEVISTRVYLDEAEELTGLSLFVRNLHGQANMLADVTAYAMSSIWSSSTETGESSA